MPDAMLAGLPRLVRVAGEIRWRGQASVAVAVGVAGYWLLQWLLDEPVKPLETLISAAAVGLITALLTMVTSVNRVREGLRETLPARACGRRCRRRASRSTRRTPTRASGARASPAWSCWGSSFCCCSTAPLTATA
jgi:hypothetical protein